MKVMFFSAIIALAASQLSGQTNIWLHIHHQLGDGPFAFDQPAFNNLGNQFSIYRMEYYLSGFSFEHDGGTLTTAPDAYLLVDAGEQTEVLLGNFDIDILEKINFGVGVDAAVNTADPALWPSDHPLSFQSPSMHWGWSSGYRFVAAEGNAGQDLNIGFQMHGLWDDNYYIQTITAEASALSGDLHIHLNADYTQAFTDIDLMEGPIDHGTDETDLEVLVNFRNLVFSASPVGVEEAPLYGSRLMLAPNPSSGSFRASGISGAFDYRIADLTGRLVQSGARLSGETIVTDLPTGIYTITCLQGSKGLGTARLMIEQ